MLALASRSSPPHHVATQVSIVTARLFGTTLCLALALGCTPVDEDDVRDDLPALCAADDLTCDPYDEVHFLGTWADGVCRFLHDCCDGTARLAALRQLVGEAGADQLLALHQELLSDKDECIVAVALGLSGGLQDDVSALVDDRRTFDRDAAEECLGYLELGAEMCAPVLLLGNAEDRPASCDAMFAPAIGRGGVCYSSDDCKDDEDGAASTCMRSGDEGDGGVRVSISGRCEAIPGERDACASVAGECSAGLFCDPDTGVCSARRGAGESCVGAPCGEALYCRTPDLVCALRGAEGDACFNDEQCALSLRCDEERHVCEDASGPSSLEASYDYCLGDQDNASLRDLLPDALLDPLLSDLVGRFLVQSFAAAVSAADDDDDCGFAAAETKADAEIDGATGEVGSATYTLASCAIELDALTEVLSDCRRTGTRASGRVVVSGTKVLRGMLTGDVDAPVIPLDDTPALYELTLAPEGWVANAQGVTLTMSEGSISGSFVPRTARAEDSGACTVPTGMARFDDILVEAVEIIVDSGLGQQERTLDAATLRAVTGHWGDDKNVLVGSLTLDGEERELPLDDAGLDPAFDEALFAASWQCEEDLSVPVSHQCDFLETAAHGVGALSVQTIGLVASLIDDDTSCGFAAAEVLGDAIVTGGLGRDESSVVLEISSPCVLTFDEETVVHTDCHGVETSVRGAVSVTGSKRLEGFLTGNPASPIVPTSREAATLTLSLDFDGLEVRRSGVEVGARMAAGTLSGIVRPRLALDTALGACVLSTPVVAVDDLAWSDGTVVLLTEDGDVALSVPASDIDAQVGETESRSNVLAGSLTLLDTAYALPVASVSPGLDDDFDAARFSESYACTPNLEIPDTEEACSFRETLAPLAAAALVQSVAVAAQIVNSDDGCGFSSAAAGGTVTLTGAGGQMGSASFAIDECTIGPLPADTTLAVDCLGTATKAGGAITASASMTIEGLRQDANPPVVPLAPASTTVSYSSLVLDGFSTYTLPSALTSPAFASTVTGALQTVLRPMAGESESAPGVYSVPTPVAAIDSLTTVEAAVTLVLEGSTFKVTVSDASLDAFAGAFEGKRNRLAGTLVVDGQAMELPTPQPLVPGYSQATFDASYACTPDLVAPLTP